MADISSDAHAKVGPEMFSGCSNVLCWCSQNVFKLWKHPPRCSAMVRLLWLCCSICYSRVTIARLRCTVRNAIFSPEYAAISDEFSATTSKHFLLWICNPHNFVPVKDGHDRTYHERALSTPRPPTSCLRSGNLPHQRVAGYARSIKFWHSWHSW